MKCPNCHGETTNENICDMCGFPITKDNNNRKKANTMYKGINKVNKAKNKLFIILLILVISSFIGVKSNILTKISAAFENTIIIVTVLIVIFSIIFVSFIFFGILKNKKDYKKLINNGEKIQGTIVDNKNEKEIYIGGKGYYPIVEFIVDGRKYRTIGYKKNLKKYEKGLSLPVRYNSEDPTESIVADE